MSHADDFSACVSRARPRARIDHTCSACRETIPAGTIYTRIGVVHDGSASTVKHCGRCRAIFSAICARDPREPIDLLLDCGESWLDAFGEPEPPEVAALAFMLPHEVSEEDVLTAGVGDPRRARKIADRINSVATTVGRSPIDVLAAMATAITVSAALAGPPRDE